MLSIIVSSYQKKYYDQLVKNISETIGDGFQYEIIQIWNPGLMSITKAYNTGAEKAKYENLLFLHEDLIFQTKNWGIKLIEHLSQSDTGILGVAGSSYVPSAPSSWTVSDQYNFVNILQGNKENTEYIHLQTTKHTTKVIAVDGVFLSITKEHYHTIKFNESLDGFHGYDLDFSLRASRHYQNYIIDDILIQHFSNGNLDKKWLDANIKVRQNLGADFIKKTDSCAEKKAFLSFLYKYFQHYPVSKKNIFFTLGFYPWKRLSIKDHFLIAKRYFNYIRYASDINKTHI
ncbi:glycosyltransferase [Chryseobacterium gallinarum]|uniref:Streptomycin biosynthesis protein StrF domain-containing protein n=1 Tax=Chryseobacterium gallinarum TaxID=1324352 RepID=A0ABX6KS18_CHRGL|nr:glycosyltransferase [Chryseobacterium gallinarum]MCL8536464.1 glycosyltransferase family protein [Chryseobacterium gallinarum]QIY91411.1 hypothetical protein FOB44_12505 [Chryseobacterium gallinarum]